MRYCKCVGFVISDGDCKDRKRRYCKEECERGEIDD